MIAHIPAMNWVIVALVVLATGVGPAWGQAVVYVDASATGAGDGSSWADAFTSVQPALDAAQDSDQVWVAAGTYVETIALTSGVGLYGGFAGNEDPATFDLTDRAFTANETILDGNGEGTVVTGEAGATQTTRIDGFTITGASWGGSGVRLEDSSPTITNNRITVNRAHTGGGVYSLGSSPTIANNTITENDAVNGGGLYVGGGSPTIANNVIAANRGSELCGGLLVAGSSAVIANNMIMGNDTWAGGGLYVASGSPTIANNTITGNTTYGSTGHGGGLRLAGTPTVVNTIVAFNSSGIYVDSGSPTLRRNCVYGNDEYDYMGIPDPTGTSGNISADPTFVETPDPGPDGTWGTGDDDPGDVRLRAESPCVDVGNNAYVHGDADLDGYPRVVDGDLDGTDIVDMGAYEFQGPVIAYADIKPGACPNTLNRNSQGVLPVAVLGTNDFDATAIDVASVRLSRADGLGGAVAPNEGPPGPHSVFEDAGTPFGGQSCECHDETADGLMDLSMKFRTADVVAALEFNALPPGDLVELFVTGNLLDGTPFAASDCIRLVHGRGR
jgi:hypothetical protein